MQGAKDELQYKYLSQKHGEKQFQLAPGTSTRRISF
jgi:hypothetical protein